MPRRRDPSPEGATGPAGEQCQGTRPSCPGPRGGPGPVGGAELAQDAGHMLFDRVERHQVVAIRLSNSPAASSRSTSSSQPVSGSARPGGAAGPPWLRRGSVPMCRSTSRAAYAGSRHQGIWSGGDIGGRGRRSGQEYTSSLRWSEPIEDCLVAVPGVRPPVGGEAIVLPGTRQFAQLFRRSSHLARDRRASVPSHRWAAETRHGRTGFRHRGADPASRSAVPHRCPGIMSRSAHPRARQRRCRMPSLSPAQLRYHHRPASWTRWAVGTPENGSPSCCQWSLG